MNRLVYIDQRSGDVFEVFTDFDGEFEQALRFVDRIGIDPIIYDRLCDIHDGARHEIEGMLIRNRRKVNNVL